MLTSVKSTFTETFHLCELDAQHLLFLWHLEDSKHLTRLNAQGNMYQFSCCKV